jgi:hypothetical protein
MATTYEKIATVTVGAGGAASIDFTSIPSTYSDLVVKVSARMGNAANSDDIFFKFNSSTGSFTAKYLQGTGSSTPLSGSYSQFAGEANSANSTASTFSNFEVYVPNYAGSNYKSYSGDSVTEINSATNNQLFFIAGLWSSTSAVNAITLYSATGASFAQYSSATIYGIKNS